MKNFNNFFESQQINDKLYVVTEAKGTERDTYIFNNRKSAENFIFNTINENFIEMFDEFSEDYIEELKEEFELIPYKNAYIFDTDNFENLDVVSLNVDGLDSSYEISELFIHPDEDINSDFKNTIDFYKNIKKFNV